MRPLDWFRALRPRAQPPLEGRQLRAALEQAQADAMILAARLEAVEQVSTDALAARVSELEQQTDHLRRQLEAGDLAREDWHRRIKATERERDIALVEQARLRRMIDAEHDEERLRRPKLFERARRLVTKS